MFFKKLLLALSLSASAYFAMEASSSADTIYWVKFSYRMERSFEVAPDNNYPPVTFLGKTARDLPIAFFGSIQPSPYYGWPWLLTKMSYKLASKGVWTDDGSNTYFKSYPTIYFFYYISIDDYYKVGERPDPTTFTGSVQTTTEHDDLSNSDLIIQWTSWAWAKITVPGPTPPPDPTPASSKNNGDPDFDEQPCDAKGEGGEEANPISAATGNKFQVETDLVCGTSVGLSFDRYYNSMDTSGIAFGTKWHSTWDSSLNIAATEVTATRPSGSQYVFKNNGAAFVADPDVRLTLTPVPQAGAGQTGWKLATANDAIENYDLAGRLTSIQTRSGRVTALTRDSAGRLTRVTGPFGHKLNFVYDAKNRMTKMTAPDGGVYLYAYDPIGNLVSVTYPDGSVRGYVYENSVFPSALTGIVDELGVRFATFGYDSRGRAILSEHAGGVDRVLLSFSADGSSTTVTDARGNFRRYDFATQFSRIKPISLSGAPKPGSKGRAFAFDANGFLSSRTDWNNNVTTYTHDARGNETSRLEASGSALARKITTTWHPSLHLPTQIKQPGRVTTFAYDGQGNLLAETITAGALMRTYAYTYNSNGQVLTAQDPLGHVTAFTYFANGNIASVTNALGQVTSFTNYDGAGRLLRSVDPNGVATTFTYDPRGRLTSRKVGALKTSFEYDATGNLLRVTKPDNSFLAFKYDAAHRLIETKDALGNRIAYTLNPAGGVTEQQVFDSANVMQRRRSYEYDFNNRMARLVQATGQTTHFGYDAQGNLISVVDPRHANDYAYDALNRMSQTTDSNRRSTIYTYNVLDRVNSVTDPLGLTTKYSWNGLDDSPTTRSPDAGVTRRTFDAAGNVLTSTDGRGKTTTYDYDPLNRRTSETYADGARVVWQYDQGPNAIGRLTGITESTGATVTGSTSYSYNVIGQLIGKVQIVNGMTRTTLYRYDASGRLSRIGYPSGMFVNYAYDIAGRVSGVTKDSGEVLVTGVTYAPFGEATAWTFGNGTAYARTFDQDGRVTGINLPNAENITLTYDNGGRITGFADTATSAKIYAYDVLDRLTNYTGGAITQRFLYDANGNRTYATFQDGVNNNSFNYTYASGSNRLQSLMGAWSENFTYNGAGATLTHTTSAANYAFAYDARGRLVWSKVGALATTYGINALGQRVLKAKPVSAGDKTHFAYDEAGHLIGEYDATGALIQETVWLDNLPLATVRAGGSFYIAPDHLGAPHQITNGSQQIVWLWDHDPFGNGAPTSVGGFTYNLRFPGQYYDQETGLHYNYFRDYDPNLGRYIESDPIGLAGGINTYTYVGGNPVSKADPLGLWCYHGNWCGPTWTGGKFEPYNPAHLSEYAWPIDSLDAACLNHDIAYSNCRKIWNRNEQAKCMTGADRQLANNAAEAGHKYGSPLWWWMNYNTLPSPEYPSSYQDTFGREFQLILIHGR